jgi:hypothetical protein
VLLVYIGCSSLRSRIMLNGDPLLAKVNAPEVLGVGNK